MTAWLQCRVPRGEREGLGEGKWQEAWGLKWIGARNFSGFCPLGKADVSEIHLELLRNSHQGSDSIKDVSGDWKRKRLETKRLNYTAWGAWRKSELNKGSSSGEGEGLHLKGSKI